MEALNFNFKFDYNGERIPAACQVIQPHRYPQFRVVIEEENSRELVFVLYKVNDPIHNFFWCPLEKQKEGIVKAIARALEKAG